MDFIQTSNKQVDKFGPGKHGFSAGNPAGGVQATYFSPEWADGVQQELINIVEGAGVVPTAAVLTQVRQAIKRLAGGNVTTVNFAGSPFALTADHAGLVLVDATAGNVVINLPAANVLAGLPYEFRRTDTSVNTVTVNRAGADTIDEGGVSFTLLSKEAGKIRSNGGTTWSSVSTQVFPTPAQFDNTTKAATTAFVQRALGSNSGKVDIAAATTLDASHVGKLIVLGGATGYAVTLPLASSVEDGAVLEFLNVLPTGCTIQRQGANLMQDGVGTFTSYGSVGPGDTLRVVANKAGSVWQVVGGTLPLRNAFGPNGPFPSSLAAPGYQKLPSGLIVQWGSSTVNTTGVTVTFPIVFPTSVYSVTAGASGVGIPANVYVAVGGKSTSSFAISSSAAAPQADWVAFGK